MPENHCHRVCLKMFERTMQSRHAVFPSEFHDFVPFLNQQFASICSIVIHCKYTKYHNTTTIMKRDSSSSLQSFMCCLLEEHSITSYDIQIDNAKRPMSARSNSVSSIHTESNSDGSGHSRGSMGRQDAETSRGRTRKSRWDC